MMNNITKKIVLASLLVLLFIPNMGYAQNVSNFFTPYGFQAPFLKSGEFVLNTSGSYSWNDSERTIEDSPDYYNRSEDASAYFRVRGLLAITNKFLFSPSFYIYPRNDNNKYNYGDTGYTREYSYDYEPYIRPSVSLIYKPVKNLEISGSYQTYNRDYTYSGTSDDVDIPQQKSMYTYSNAGISINYYGKLWDK